MALYSNTQGKYLYKYVPFNTYSLQLLVNKKFYLAPPDFLNDPFEGDFIIENYEDFYNDEFIEFIVNDEYKNYIHKNIAIPVTCNELKNDKSEFRNFLYNYLNKLIMSKFGTTSFSKKCNSITMWSHYADSHKGFVIIFDRLSLEPLDEITKLEGVGYNGVARINLKWINNNFIIDNENTLLINKLKEWGKENEVRLFKNCNLFNNRYLQFNDICLLGIIYGHRITKENLNTIDCILSNYSNINEMKFFVTEKDYKREKIIFKEIKYPLIKKNPT